MDSRETETTEQRRRSGRVRKPILKENEDLSVLLGSDSESSSDEESASDYEEREVNDADNSESSETTLEIDTDKSSSGGEDEEDDDNYHGDFFVDDNSTNDADRHSPPVRSVIVNRRQHSITPPNSGRITRSPQATTTLNNVTSSELDSTTTDSSDVSNWEDFEPWTPPEPLASDTEDDDDTITDDDATITDNEDEDMFLESDNPSNESNESNPNSSSSVDHYEMEVKLIKNGCENRKVRRKFRRAAEKIMAKLNQGNSYRCVKNKYMRKKIKPQDILCRTHQVYALLKDKDSDEIEKVGQSYNTRDRYAYDPTALERTFILVSQRTISRSLDRDLLDIIDKLLDDIWKDKSLPMEFRRLCNTVLRRGGDRIGLKRAFYMQLIEIGAQYRYGLPVQAEVFTTGEKVNEDRRLQVEKAHQTWTMSDADDVLSFVGQDIMFVSTWATGQQEDLLSSQVCANNLVANGIPWKNAMAAVYENASDPEKIFCTDWTEEQIQEGQDRVLGWVQETIDQQQVLFVAKNEEKLFPNNKLIENLQQDFNFQVKFNINGDRICSLSHKNAKAKVIVYSPLGYGIDSRPFSDMQLKVRTLMEAAVLQRLVCQLQTKPMPPLLAPLDYGMDFITAAYQQEMVKENFHGHTFTAAAVARDAITEDTVHACLQNNLPKVLESHEGHISTRARRSASYYYNTDRPIEMNIILEGANLLHMCLKPTELKAQLEKVQSYFLKCNRNGVAPSAEVVGTRWKSLIKNHIQCPRFRKQVQQIVDETFKANRGNRNAYKAFDLDNNDDVIESLWGGDISFLVHVSQPDEADKEKIYAFDPSKDEWQKWKVFKENYYVHPGNFVYGGMRERGYNRPRKGNTKAKQRRTMEGKRKVNYMKKVFVFLDDPDREPFETDDKSFSPGPELEGSTILRLCNYYEEYVDDVNVDMDHVRHLCNYEEEDFDNDHHVEDDVDMDNDADDDENVDEEQQVSNKRQKTN